MKTKSPSTLFRAELKKIMPGYVWTVEKSNQPEKVLRAEGTISNGLNRMSTLNVIRLQDEKTVSYKVKSSGYGIRAKWLHSCEEPTLARALRELQKHYEEMELKYSKHAKWLQWARTGQPTNIANVPYNFANVTESINNLTEE